MKVSFMINLVFLLFVDVWSCTFISGTACYNIPLYIQSFHHMYVFGCTMVYEPDVLN